MLPRPRHVVWLSRAASPQFARPYAFRVSWPQPWSTCDGWVWLHGYELDGDGDAVGEAARNVFVRLAGLYRLPDPPPKARAPQPAPRRRVQPTWHLEKEARQ